MKVLIVGLGGVTRTFRHWPERVLALALTHRGHTVWSIGTRDSNRPALAEQYEVIEDVTVYRVQSGYWPNLELMRALNRGPRPDVIHLMHPRNVLAAQVSCWAARHSIPTVYTWLGPFHDAYITTDRERPYEAPTTIERAAFTPKDMLRQMVLERKPREALRNYRLHWPLRAATALIPCSEFEAMMMRRFGLTQPQTVVPLWIDRAFIESTPCTRITNPRLLGDAAPHDSTTTATTAITTTSPDIPPRPWLLFVGQLTTRKGYDLAIECLPSIIAAYPQASLLIVSGINQAQREHTMQLAHKLGVAEHIHILGYLPDDELINLYRSSDALLFPTRFEGFGLPLLEAMAAECPIITTDIPVVNEIVQNGENGILVPYGNAAALAQATIRLLNNDALRSQLIRGGKTTLRERYDEDKLVNTIHQVYASIQNTY